MATGCRGPARVRTADEHAARRPPPHRSPPPRKDDDLQTATPPPGFFASTKALLANPVARILVAIVLVLLVVLGVFMVIALGDTSDEPGPGAAVAPLLALLRSV